VKHRTTVAILSTLALTSAALAQEMPAPTFKVGDRWAFRETDLLTKSETGRWTETVTAVDPAEYWIDSLRSSRTIWRGDNAKRVHREQFLFDEAAPNQRGKTVATNDAGCAYPWPLKVGSKWECTEVVTFPNGWRVRYELKFTVEAAESVETPAGRFDTLRLEAKGFATNETNNNNVTGHERIVWLAPAAKREVRHEIRTRLRTGALFRSEGRELTEFKPGP
jgi:hypothetical protein